MRETSHNPSNPPVTPQDTGRVEDVADEADMESPEIRALRAMSLDDFCFHYDLTDRILSALRRLGMSMGDNLDRIRPERYLDVGFTDESWQQVLTAYYNYRRDARLI